MEALAACTNATEEILFSVVGPGGLSRVFLPLLSGFRDSLQRSQVILIKNTCHITENRWKAGPPGTWTLRCWFASPVLAPTRSVPVGK